MTPAITAFHKEEQQGVVSPAKCVPIKNSQNGPSINSAACILNYKMNKRAKSLGGLGASSPRKS